MHRSDREVGGMTFAAVAVANPDRLPILSEWNWTKP